MSEMERNKGKLVPTEIDTENFSDADWDSYTENGFAVIDGEIYEVDWEIQRGFGGIEFADVKVNEDGSIDFHTYHYNSRAHWTEVVEDAL